METEKQRDGTIVETIYDANNRIWKRNIDGSGTEVEGTTFETYAYDELSRLTEAVNDFSTVKRKYDSLNRLTEEEQMGKVIKYTYVKMMDKKSLRQTLQYPNNRIIERDFDVLNRISKIREADHDLAAYEYIGRTYRLLTKQYNNGDVINYLYDQGRRLTSKEARNKNSDLISKYVYGYNKVNMKTFEQRVHDSGKGDVSSYDDIYRLTDVKFNSPEPDNPSTTQFERSWSAQYDKVLNILKIVESQNGQTSEIATTMEGNNLKLNQYTTFDQWGLDYDLNGNMSQKGGQRFYYDYRNQLVRVVEGGATKAEYKYDALGRRISEQLTYSTTQPLTSFYYDGNQVIEERDGSDQIKRQLIYGNGIDELLIIVNYDGSTAIPYYVHTNEIGSTTAITNQDGNVVERVSYDTFGMPIFTDHLTDPQNPTVVENSVIGNDVLFQGRRYDKETNLIYFRARYYDPIMGRFLSVDPMGYQDSMNLYQAFNMNPVNFVDPFGLYGIDFHFYVIYYMMKAKGWKYEVAEKVAGWSQYPDDSPLTDPDPESALNVSRSLVNSLYITDIFSDPVRYFHFHGSSFDFPVEKNDRHARSLVQNAAEEFDDLSSLFFEKYSLRLGVSLHIYADTWAHEGFRSGYNINNVTSEFSLRPIVGHAHAGSKPDMIILNETNISKALDAAKHIWELIPEYEYCMPDEKMKWEEFQAILKVAFSKYTGKDELTSELSEAIVIKRLKELFKRKFWIDATYNKSKYRKREKYFKRNLKEYFTY